MTKPIPRTKWETRGAQNDMIGRHVEIPATSDLWKSGVRMGRIVAVRRVNSGAEWQAKVAMDYYAQTPVFMVADLQPITVREGHVTFAHALEQQ